MEFILEPLNLVTFFPLLGVILLLLIKNEHKNAARWISLIVSVITLGISMVCSPR